MTFKLMHGLVDCDPGTFFEPARMTSTRGHCMKLTKQTARTARRSSVFALRVVDAWNSLPESVVTAPSVKAFEARLDDLWKEEDLMYKWDAAQPNESA
jgi:hypothetical protein